jgi:hypothetical protein
MSYFNSEQRGEMDRLSRIPPDRLCYCGWYDLGDCPSCPPGRTAAHKIALRCPDTNCHNHPPADKPDAPITHNIACRLKP